MNGLGRKIAIAALGATGGLFFSTGATIGFCELVANCRERDLLNVVGYVAVDYNITSMSVSWIRSMVRDWNKGSKCKMNPWAAVACTFAGSIVLLEAAAPPQWQEMKRQEEDVKQGIESNTLARVCCLQDWHSLPTINH